MMRTSVMIVAVFVMISVLSSLHVDACRLVTGAGRADINGQYLPVGTYDGVTRWMKGKYSILRYRFPSGNTYWYFTWYRDTSGSGGTDHDYYRLKTPASNPPLTGWYMDISECLGPAPMPTLQVCSDHTDDGSPRNATASHTSTVNMTLNTEWSSVLPPRTMASSCRAANGRVIIVGGLNENGTASNTTSLYDPATQRWYADVAIGGSIGPVNDGIAVGDICIFYGGITGYLSNRVHRFNLTGSLDSLLTTTLWWSWKPNNPSGVAADGLWSPAAVTYGGQWILGAGGELPSGSLTTRMQIYDPVADIWSADDTLAVARTDIATAALHDWAYFIGGSNTGVGQVDAWHRVTHARITQPMPSQISRAGMACVAHDGIDKIFCSGGYDPNQSKAVSNTILAFTPGVPLTSASGSWAILTGAFLSAARYGHVGFLFQSRILFGASSRFVGTSATDANGALLSHFDMFNPYLYTSIAFNDTNRLTTLGGITAIQFADPSKIMLYGGSDTFTVATSVVTSIKLMEYSWYFFPQWSECSVVCGASGHMDLPYQCEDQDMNVVNNSYCKHDFHRRVIQPCFNYCPSHWQPNDWNTCSKTCGTGVQTRTIDCRDDVTSDIVDIAACNATAGVMPSLSQSCNIFACPSWNITEWSACSVPCGGDGFQTRTPYCIYQGVQVNASLCADAVQPSWTTSQSCNNQYCPSHWQISSWNECTKSCETGLQSRNVECRDDATDAVMSNITCISVAGARPIDHQYCNTFLCPQWAVTIWSECSVTCGNGIETRTMQCHDWNATQVDESLCPHVVIETSRACHKSPCPIVSSTGGSKEESGDGKSTSSVTMYIGVGVGIGVGGILTVAIIFFCCCKRPLVRKQKAEETSNGIDLTRTDAYAPSMDEI